MKNCSEKGDIRQNVQAALFHKTKKKNVVIPLTSNKSLKCYILSLKIPILALYFILF